MSKKFDLLVFDWDGTLMDSAATIVASIQAVSQDLGLPFPERERAAHVIGLGLQEALAHVFPTLPPSDYLKAVERYRHHYLARHEEVSLFTGVVELLEHFHERGYFLAVATGKSRGGLDRVLQATGLIQRFHASRCADECFSKPHPAMLLELMEQLDVAADKTLMIGDTTHDLQMAKNARVQAVGICHGAHAKNVLLDFQPLHLVEDIVELTAWLKQNA